MRAPFFLPYYIILLKSEMCEDASNQPYASPLPTRPSPAPLQSALKELHRRSAEAELAAAREAISHAREVVHSELRRARLWGTWGDLAGGCRVMVG